MADILDELIGGGVAPAELVKALRSQVEYGTAGALSGSKRLAPAGAALREEALGQASEYRQRKDRAEAAKAANAMEALKARMAAAERAADRDQRARDNAANRQLTRDLAALKEQGANARAQLKAKGKTTPEESANAISAQAEEFDRLAQRASTALSRVGVLSAGLGSLSKILPGSPAKNLDEYLQPLRSEAALGALADLKAKSKNGASGLGSVTENEIALLMSRITSLDTGQSPDQLREALTEIQQRYQTLAEHLRQGAENQIKLESGDSDETAGSEDDIEGLMRGILEDHPELASELEALGG